MEGTVLVVDDRRENLNIIGQYFKEKGLKLAFATNGPDALKILETTEVDLVLLDVMMPEMDGYTVCRKIKENPKTMSIPVIFLTAKTGINDVYAGFEAGGVDYVAKPFNTVELMYRVQTHLELKHTKEKVEYQAEELRKSNMLLMKTLSDVGKFFTDEK
ncbi:MAG: response regulator [Bacteroidota bacterium]